ncbi:MAG: TRASH domain-containing protein [Armatimonadota bacterium]|nr:TRASH domain-containing protein [Armatimonadota bacterium]
MICDYCGHAIAMTPYIVKMQKQTDRGVEVGDRFFHDDDCYRLFVEDDYEYEVVGLTGGEA